MHTHMCVRIHFPLPSMRTLQTDMYMFVTRMCMFVPCPVAENQNKERMSELLPENNMVALNTLFARDPFTWTKIAGRPSRLDYICASTELLATTTWAGVRKVIDVGIGSAEDHWPGVADVCLQIGLSKGCELKESKHEHSVSIDRSPVQDQNRVRISKVGCGN